MKTQLLFLQVTKYLKRCLREADGKDETEADVMLRPYCTDNHDEVE